MQGDKRIDKLMLPVLNAINRHVKDRDAKTDIYNRAYEAVMISMVVKNEQRHIEFCPNCEADVPCTHEAELFVCDICGEDFAKYIVSRNCTLPDVSMTQDVLTTIKTEGMFIVCQKCRGLITLQAEKNIFNFCPACGRRIVRRV